MYKTANILAKKFSDLLGSIPMLLIACTLILCWLTSGFYFHFSNKWELIINSANSIITFIMVFIIQHSQNRESLSIHIKLDELIRSHKSAHNSLINLDRLSDKQLKAIEQELNKISLEREAEKHYKKDLESILID